MRLLRTALPALSALGLALAGCPEKKIEPAAEPAPAERKEEPKAEQPKPEEPAAAAPAAASPTEIGSIEGEVLFDGPAPELQPLKRGGDPVCNRGEAFDEAVLVKNGKLSNVVVRLKDAPARPPPQEPVVIDQLHCIYRPRVQGAMKGQSLQVKNSDGTIHNVHTYEGTKTWFNVAQPPRGKDLVRPIDREGVVRFACDVHPWMRAYVVLSTHPYFATTGEDGAFAIKDVPAGAYTLEAWHERYGAKTQQVAVEAGKPVKASFTFKPEER